MIPYYSPNYGFADLIKTLFCSRSEEKLTSYFRELTQKKYILITSSCRSAIYLAYKSIEKTGTVHTSPLTCKVALLPILFTGNKIFFSDIQKNDWTLDPGRLRGTVNKESIAIQAIHLGGFLCDMPVLRQIADENNLVLIEDCAQGFGSSCNTIQAGRLSDVACFTLTKNLYGIGGGILATDKYDYYKRAKTIQESFTRESRLKLINRVLVSLLSTYRSFFLTDRLYRLLISLKQNYVKKKYSDVDGIFEKDLKRPNRFSCKSVASRLKKIERLNQQRKRIAINIIESLTSRGFVFQENDKISSTYAKLFCYNENIDSREFIKAINDAGIEGMHLEHKNKVHYQERFDKDSLLREGSSWDDLSTFMKIHDHVISIPLLERLSANKVRELLEVIAEAKH